MRCAQAEARPVDRSTPLTRQVREAYRIEVGGDNAPREYVHEGDRALRTVCMPSWFWEA